MQGTEEDELLTFLCLSDTMKCHPIFSHEQFIYSFTPVSLNGEVTHSQSLLAV